MAIDDGLKAATPPIRSNPFQNCTPDAVTTSKCGVCGGSELIKYFECRSLDSTYAPIYMCRRCCCLYNATAEFEQMDVVEWQKRWVTDPEFYKVPTGGAFEVLVDSAAPTFDFFERDLDVKFSGNYMEIGAGSGMMAAAAMRYFDDVYVLDHVKDRLQQVRAVVGDRYHVIDFDESLAVQADVILIWHAMEHFLSPGGVFEMCAQQLKPNGYLLLQVPVLTAEHVYPGHYYFYNEVTLELLARANGLKVVRFYYDYVINAITASFQKITAN